MRKNISHAAMKEQNRSRILNTVFLEKSISRAEIAKLTKLDKKGVGNFVQELMEEKILIEVGVESTSKKGRPKTLLEFDSSHHLLAGIVLKQNCCSLEIRNLKLDLLDGEEIDLDQRPTLDSIKKIILKFLDVLKAKYSKTIEGLGFCFSGIWDRDQQIVLSSTTLPCLEGWKLDDFLKSHFKSPIMINDNVKASALAEIWYGEGKRLDNFYYLSLGAGVGSAIVIDKKIYEGSRGLAGEIGHIEINSNGSMCYCGSKGCLETCISTHRVIEEVNTCIDKKLATIHEICEHLDNPKVKNVINQIINNLVKAIQYVVKLLDIKDIIIHGELLNISPTFLNDLEKSLESVQEKRFLRKINLKRAGNEGAATAMVLQNFLS